MGPLNPGTKYARVTVRIHIREEASDSVFVIIRQRSKYDAAKQQNISANEVDYVQFSKDGLIEIPGHRREQVDLLIVPRKAAEPYQTAHELADAAFRIPTATMLGLQFQEEVPSWYGSDFVVNYRLERRPDEKFELIRTTIDPTWPCCVICIAVPIATIFGGLWLVRRYARRWRAAFPKTPPPAPPPA